MTSALAENHAAKIGQRRREPRVRVIQRIAEIDEIRPAWESWNYHPNSDMDFYLRLMECRPQIERPHIITVYRDEEPEAMLIGRTVRQRIEFQIGYKPLLRPKVRLLNFVYGGALGDFSDEGSRLVVESIVGSLRRGEADVANLNYIRTDSPLYRCALRVPGLLSRDFFLAPQPHWQITLRGGADCPFPGSSAKDLRELRRKGRRLLADHPDQVRICRFSKSTELDRMIGDIEAVAKGSYQRGLGAGFIASDEMRNLLRFQAQKEWLRAYILYVAEKPCAFWLGNAYRGVFYGSCIGYDTKYAKYAPGKYLMMKGAEDLCREGIERVDFGLGDGEYKRMLSDLRWEEASPYIFAPSLSGLRLNLLRTPIAFVDRFAKYVLEHTGLVAKVRRTWRDLLKGSGKR